MSKFTITYSPHETQKITVDQSVDFEFFEFVFELNLSALRMDISTLSANLTLKKNSSGDTLFSETFPKDGHSMESTDQARLFSRSVILEPNVAYSLEISATMNEVESTVTLPFRSPRPVQLFPSWTWSESNNSWVPPIPKPGILFYWDEELYNASEYPWIEQP